MRAGLFEEERYVTVSFFIRTSIQPRLFDGKAEKRTAAYSPKECPAKTLSSGISPLEIRVLFVYLDTSSVTPPEKKKKNGDDGVKYASHTPLFELLERGLLDDDQRGLGELRGEEEALIGCLEGEGLRVWKGVSRYSISTRRDLKKKTSAPLPPLQQGDNLLGLKREITDDERTRSNFRQQLDFLSRVLRT